MKIPFYVFFLLTGLASAAPEEVESIAAIVDGKVILKSDVMASVQQAMSSPVFAHLDPKAQQQQVLQSMIDEKVILSRADRDSITVTETEVRARVDAHIQQLAGRQHMELKDLEKAIHSQTGFTMAQYREQLSSQIHDQILLGRIRQRHVGVIQPTRQEVESFYKEYKDSLPLQYNSILVSHIQVKVQPDSSILDSVHRLALAIVDSLDHGQAWEIMAKRHSQDSVSARGGDLGYFRKGLLEPEFERAAWRLQIGQYTDAPVKTRFGWHVIKILGKKDDQIRTAHILLKTVASSADSLHAMALIDSLRTVAEAGKVSFAELAGKFSDDAETNFKKGSLGWMERTELDSAYQQVIANLDPGQVSEKVKIDDAWHIFRLDSALSSREMNLADDYAKIEDFTTNNMGNKKLQELVARWRKEVYIEIRLK